MLMIGGSAANYAKMMNKMQTMQQRMQNPTIAKQENGRYDEKRAEQSAHASQMKQLQDRAAEDRENAEVGGISLKLELGQELSDKDLDILKRKAPGLYVEAIKVAKERRMYRKQVSQCRTKDQVEIIRQGKLHMPESNLKAAILNEHIKFVKSDRYAKLPWEHELGSKKKPEREEPIEKKKKSEDKAEKMERDPAVKKKLDALDGQDEAQATVPEATVPEATAPEATAPEATAPEATAPEAAAPEVTAPEAAAPEVTAPEAGAPEAAAPAPAPTPAPAPAPAPAVQFSAKA